MTETTHDLAWRELGNCVGVDPDLFFGGRGDNKSHAAAKRVCAGCEVRDECLAYALDNNERFGVWGGLSERQRRALRPRGRRLHGGPVTADLDQLRQAAQAASVARQERDEAIRAAITGGAPLRAVAAASGLSVAGVARIRDRA